MLYGKTEEQLIGTLDQFLTICAQYGLKVSIKKSNFSSSKSVGADELLMVAAM